MILNYQFFLVALFVLCIILSLLINHIMLRFAQTLGIRNRNSTEIRWNPETKPALGGISFFVIFLIAFILSVLVPVGEQELSIRMIGVLVAATLAFLMGLADDAFNTEPLLKLFTQIFCGLVVIFCGHSIAIFDNSLLNYALTVLWVVGLMNSINMLDNMDGISSIVSMLASAFMILVTLQENGPYSYMTILNLGVLGALCGFLFYNFHPSKMFMGDTGSQFLGLFLAVMGIDNCWNNPGAAQNELYPFSNILVVLLVFLLPLTDTTTVVINRLVRGSSPFVGGKDHTTHHLYFRGITEKRIAILYGLIGTFAVWLAYQISYHFSPIWFWIGLTFAIVIFLGLYLNTVIRKR